MSHAQRKKSLFDVPHSCIHPHAHAGAALAPFAEATRWVMASASGRPDPKAGNTVLLEHTGRAPPQPNPIHRSVGRPKASVNVTASGAVPDAIKSPSWMSAWQCEHTLVRLEGTVGPPCPRQMM